jgi:hypothetical protein
MIEDWSPIEGYDRRYEVSTFGRARSWVRHDHDPGMDEWPHLMHPVVADNGHGTNYARINIICADGKRRSRLLHRLVLNAFVGPRPPGKEVRHLNGNGTDNHIANLSYGTHSENLMDRRRHGTANCGERNGNARFTEEDVVAMRDARRSGMSYAAIGKPFGAKARQIMQIVTGERWALIPGAVPRGVIRCHSPRGQSCPADEDV